MSRTVEIEEFTPLGTRPVRLAESEGRLSDEEIVRAFRGGPEQGRGVNQAVADDDVLRAFGAPVSSEERKPLDALKGKPLDEVDQAFLDAFRGR